MAYTQTPNKKPLPVLTKPTLATYVTATNKGTIHSNTALRQQKGPDKTGLFVFVTLYGIKICNYLYSN